MKDNNTDVILPLAGSGVLGAGAYGSHLLDDFLHRHGISRDLKFNPRAIRDINNYAYATPGAKNPSDFIYRYSDLANRASSSRLFKNDPRKAWELFTNETDLFRPISKTLRPVNTYARKLYNLGKKYDKNPVIKKVIDYILAPSKAGISSIYSFATPLADHIDKTKNKAYKVVRTMVGAHEAELAQSPVRAIIRLFNEAGGNSAMTNRNFNTTWKKPEQLARETANAIYAWRNTINPETGKEFKSIGEAYAYMYDVPDAQKIYGDYFKFFENVKGKDKKKILDKVRKILAPAAFEKLQSGEVLTHLDKSVLNAEVKNKLGSMVRWVLNKETGKLEPPTLPEGVPWFTPKNGIKTVNDVKKIVKKSPGLTWLKSELSNVYRGAEFGGILKALRTIQFLRNRKLQLALGAGSALLGGLGMYNLGKNNISNN